MRETERDFWVAWRIRWVPRFITAASVVLLLGIADCVQPWRWRMGEPPQRIVTDSVFILNAQVMAQVCHAWLRRAKTAKDTTNSLEYLHTDFAPTIEKRRTYMCLNWMVFAGEQP